MRIVSYLTSALFVSFALNGCAPLANPTFLPAGYTHHQGEFKSPPGVKAAAIGYDYSSTNNAEVLEAWRGAAAELVYKIEAQTDVDAQDVFLNPPKHANAFSHSFDHTLREALRARGYFLLHTPSDDALIITPGAHDTALKGAMPSFELNDRSGDEEPQVYFRDIMLSAALKKGNLVLGKVQSLKTLPAYGYENTQLFLPVFKEAAFKAPSGAAQ